MPWFGSDVLIQFGINALLLAVLAQGWNIIGGYTGYRLVRQFGFLRARQLRRRHRDGAVATAVRCRSDVRCGACGRYSPCCSGMPVLRLKGHYFAIATLALAQVMTAIVSNMNLAGQNIGLVLPPLNNDPLFYELSLGLLVLATLTIFWLTRSRFGFGLIAIRENEEGAAVMGVNTTLYKMLAFALSGIFTALAGGIHAYWITFIDPESAFDIGLNVKMIIMAVFGGPGTVSRSGRRRVRRCRRSPKCCRAKITNLAGLFFGIVVVAAVVLMPRGLADMLRQFPQYGLALFRRKHSGAHRL